MDTDADRERARGVPPMFPGGARQSVSGCIGFGAVALFWLPVIHLVDTHLDRSRPPFLTVIENVAITAHFCLPLALACGLLRWAGYPRTAWSMLASLGTATLVWLGMLAFASHGKYHATMSVWAVIISLPAWLLSGYLIPRRTAARSNDDTDPAP